MSNFNYFEASNRTKNLVDLFELFFGTQVGVDQVSGQKKLRSIGWVVFELRASEAANIRGLAFKDRLTDLIENFFTPVLDRLLAVYQKSDQSE